MNIFYYTYGTFDPFQDLLCYYRILYYVHNYFYSRNIQSDVPTYIATSFPKFMPGCYCKYMYTVKTRVSRNSPIRSLWNALEGETVNRCLINTSVEYLYFFIPQRCLVNSNTLKQISSSSQKLQETSTIIYSSTIHFSKLE